MFPPMKKLLLSLACVGLISVPAFAGTCPAGGGCDGGKKKDGDKPAEPTTESMTVRF